MSKPANPFKFALAEGRKLQGVWSLSGSPTVVEALGHVGADFVVLDLEHSPTSVHGMLPLLHAADASGVMVVVRMPDQNPTAIKHALDLGANTLLFPFVETPEEAEALVSACLYPPHGRRGFSKMNRAARYLLDAEYPTRARDDVLIVAQLETERAVRNVEAIAGVPGIGGVFVGPGDLSASLGLIGQTAHPRVKELMVDCAKGAHRVGKTIGTVAPDADQAAWAFEAGYDYVSVSNDMALIVVNARKMQAEVRARRG